MGIARFALLLALALPAASCLEVPVPPPKDAVDIKSMTVPEGVGLETTCTPTGPEICFDARDNNCNGLIDEGCGLHTGVLQFVIAWEAPEADVDLNVFDPTGECAHTGGDPTAAGLVKDKDCPHAGECQGQNVENVFLAEGEPKKGHYKVVVHLERLNGANAPVRVRMGVRNGQKSYGMVMELSPGAGSEDKEFGFDVK